MVATKAPWPPVDGGRRLLLEQLRALAERDLRPLLVAPCPRHQLEQCAGALQPYCEPRLVARRTAPTSLAAKLAGTLDPRLLGQPWALVRHRSRALRREVEGALAEGGVDLVHAEQLQALAMLPRRTPPVVVRAQNVESDLWAALTREMPAGTLGSLVRSALRFEAQRLRRTEALLLARCARVLAVSDSDRRRLLEIGVDGDRCTLVHAPFPPRLPGRGHPLPGSPALVLSGSNDWLPNRLAWRQFVDEVWPFLRRDLPDAVLHVFGSPAEAAPATSTHDRLLLHPSPLDSRDLFDETSILLVPLRVASGIRIKILEAWARGVPVVGSPVACRGLEGRDGLSHREAATREQWLEAIRALRDPAQRRAQIDAGREALRRHHDPPSIADQMLAQYSLALSANGSRVAAGAESDRPGGAPS